MPNANPGLAVLLAIIPAYYLAVFIHEVGHVVMAKLCGYEVTSFGLGLGGPMWVGKWRGTRIYFALKKPMQGITWAIFPQLFPSRLASIGMLAGGVLANLLLAVGAALLWRFLPWGQAFWLTIVVINLVVGLPNVIPLSLRLGGWSLRSDGAQILQTIKRRQPEVPAASLFAMVRSLCDFWAAIGDWRIHSELLLTAAGVWLQMGDASHAETLCDKAEAMVVEDSPFAKARIALFKGSVECVKGEFEASAAAFDKAEALFVTLNNEAGLCLVALARAELRWQNRTLQVPSFYLRDCNPGPWSLAALCWEHCFWI